MKRVLLISHSFFETNMGAIRQRRLVRWLPRFGWEPTVLCAATPPGDARGRFVHAAAPDLAAWYRRLRRVPAETSSGGGAVVRDIRLTSLLNRWLMIPDKQAPWRKPAIRAGLRELAERRYDLLFASLEPRTNLLAAAALARRSGLPCVMEYRDLWTGSPYHHLAQPTALHRWLHHRLEAGALAHATRLTTVAEGIAGRLQAQYPRVLRDPLELNYNFFDPEEYPARGRPRGEPFVLSYVGAMYLTRQPGLFFEGLRLFLDRTGATPGRFLFRWIGSGYSLGDLEAQIERLALRPFIDFAGRMAHARALQELVDSDAALVIQSPEDQIHIPGKLFEAMGAGVPVLFLSGPCEAAGIAERTRCGLVVPHDATAVADALEQLWQRHRRNEPWSCDEPERARFSAEAAVRKLALLLDETCSTPSTPRR